MTDGLIKNIKATEEAHQLLTLAKLELFGPESVHEVRFSEVIQKLAEKQLSGEFADE